MIVDVPGSGWSGAEGYVHVPRMVELARQGFVVASIAYRGTFKDDVRFPAAVQDTKEAIRYLRANAAQSSDCTPRMSRCWAIPPADIPQRWLH